MAIDKIITSSIADDAVTNAKTSFSDVPFRNIIINGDMSQAQRGTSVNNTNGAPYLIDRFRNQAVYGSTAPTATIAISQSSTVPTGQGFAKSTKYDVTTAQSSLTTDTGYALEQRIEGQMLQHLKKGTSSAEPLTLSFWVRSNKTGTYVVELADMDNSRHCSQSYTISSADTWEKKTLNYPADTTGAYGNDNATSLKIRIWVAAGATFTSGTLASTWASTSNANAAVGQVNLVDNTSNEWYITGLQLEVGTTASDFEFVPFDVNLKRCQRYFETFPSNGGDGVIGYGYGSGSDTARTMFPFKVTKRSAPTMSDSLSSSRQYRINFTATDGTAVNQNSTSTPSFGTISTLNSGYMNLSGFSSIGGGHNGFLIYNNNTTLLSADAEL